MEEVFDTFRSSEQGRCDHKTDVVSENNYYNDTVTFCKYYTDQQFNNDLN